MKPAPEATAAWSGAGGVQLVFRVKCSNTSEGEEVFVVGSAPELGAWDPAKAVCCTTSRLEFPDWTSKAITLPASTGKIEFKIVVKKKEQSRAATWESCANRAVNVPTEPTRLNVTCTWNNPEVKSQSNDVSERDAEDDMMKKKIMEAPPMLRRASSSWLSMERSSSRHAIYDMEGNFNQGMSRTPSMMLLDVDSLQQDAAEHEKTLDAKDAERAKLNENMRRMASSALLTEMQNVTDFADPSKTVMLQGFNWEAWRGGGGDWYGIVRDKLDLFSSMGFTDIWLPPPSHSVAPQGYLPARLFDLDSSKYGTQASLEDLLREMHVRGIRGIADIVVNHRCGDKQDSQGRWNQFSSGMTSRPSFAGVMEWGGWAITLGNEYSDGSGEHGPGHTDGSFDAAPDVDHRNKKVQESIAIWLRWLRLQVGFDAWRFDFCKGYAAEFVGLYCEKTGPSWAVGELWGDMMYDGQGLCHNQDKHRQDLVNWVNATGKKSTAFDFTTKGILQEAVRNCEYWRLKDAQGKVPGLIGWMPKYAVTFIDNHDTGSTQRHWPFPDDKVLVGYAYIITHPGVPCIFWDHVMDWGEDHRKKIGDLLRVRRESGIPVDAPVKIHCADHDLYIAEVGHPAAIRVALGPRHAPKPDGSYWTEAAHGNGYRVWAHKQPAPARTMPKMPAKGAQDKLDAVQERTSPSKAAAGEPAQLPSEDSPAHAAGGPEVAKPVPPAEEEAEGAPPAKLTPAEKRGVLDSLAAEKASKENEAAPKSAPAPGKEATPKSAPAAKEESAAPAPAPAPKAKAAKEESAAPAPAPAPKEAKKERKGSIDADFKPVVVDGKQLTPQTLQKMTPKELGQLTERLAPVLDAARKLLVKS